MNGLSDILVVGEWSNGSLSVTTGELIAAGRQLSNDCSLPVAVAVFGSAPESVSQQAIEIGADKVYLLRSQYLDDGSSEVQLGSLEKFCRDIQPTIILFTKTRFGSELGPRLSFRLNVVLAQDSISMLVEQGTNRIVVHRPVYGGNAVAKLRFPPRDPQIIILRSKLYDPISADSSRHGEVSELEYDIDPDMVKIKRLEIVNRKSEGVSLEEASVIVAGGRGLGGPEPFEQLQQLADMLGGAVGASRAVCDAGWLEHSYQIGLTGKPVTPDLYITVGISGASQHMAGCSGAKDVVAINKDGDANIFKTASFGVVGDWEKVLPAFIDKVKELI